MLAVRCIPLALLSLVPATAASQDIQTPIIDVVETYHGVTVHDPYRWLEDGLAANVKAWIEAQNEHARAALDAIPVRAALKARLTALMSQGSPVFYGFKARGGFVFANLYDPGQQQETVVALDATADPASMKVVLDPNILDPSGTTTIDWWEPSPDGKLVAISLSEHGSEMGTLHFYETATGLENGDRIPRVTTPTATGAVAWNSDGSAFWYTRFPGEERPEADRMFYQQVYFHRVGANWRDDPLVLGSGDGLPRVAEIAFKDQYPGDTIVASVQKGDGGEFAHYLLTPNGALQLAAFEDKIVEIARAPDGTIFALSLAGTPNGKVLKLRPPFAPFSLRDAPVVVPESNVAIELSASLTATESHLLVCDIVGGPNQVRIFDHAGRYQGLLPLPEIAAIREIAPLADGNLLYAVRTYLQPSSTLRWDSRTGKAEAAKIANWASYSFDDVEVVREFAVSKDGTRIPLNIFHKKGVRLDGTNPTLLEGYGGYSTSQKPSFLGARERLWFDADGVYVIANIRGGGEYGESWHLAGNLTRKQNVFDDFSAAARYLIDRKFTSSARLAIYGQSNGGLLMGATLTQDPVLARAVVASVGIYDILRAELDANGEFNVTEFGSVKDPEQFKALYAYSPYHHVAKGTAYPAVLLITGVNDGRVNALQSRKFAATLQAASTSGRPILLYTTQSGHGIGDSRDQWIEGEADVLAFLYDQLGLTLATAPR